jgi:hypothetical protein
MRTILGWFSKKVRASSTDISSTSAIVIPRQVISRVSRL